MESRITKMASSTLFPERCITIDDYNGCASEWNVCVKNVKANAWLDWEHNLRSVGKKLWFYVRTVTYEEMNKYREKSSEIEQQSTFGRDQCFRGLFFGSDCKRTIDQDENYNFARIKFDRKSYDEIQFNSPFRMINKDSSILLISLLKMRLNREGS